jgi:hypothetical protein
LSVTRRAIVNARRRIANGSTESVSVSLVLRTAVVVMFCFSRGRSSSATNPMVSEGSHTTSNTAGRSSPLPKGCGNRNGISILG